VGQQRRWETLNKLKQKAGYLSCSSVTMAANSAVKRRVTGLTRAWSRLNSYDLASSPTRVCRIINGTFCDESLNLRWFKSLSEAKQLKETWRLEYNMSYCYRVLAHRTPIKFASQVATSHDLAETQIGRQLTN